MNRKNGQPQTQRTTVRKCAACGWLGNSTDPLRTETKCGQSDAVWMCALTVMCLTRCRQWRERQVAS